MMAQALEDAENAKKYMHDKAIVLYLILKKKINTEV